MVASIIEAEILHPEYTRSIKDKHAPGPLKDDGVIRVYHGFNDLGDAVDACHYGISGKTRAERRYSYEANNNPKGLFVTASLDTAKDFVGAYGDAAIIEFHARAEDLEAPVWPGGTYTVQGQKEQYFDTSTEQAFKADREKARIAAREASKEFASSRPWADNIGKSDRAELARSLYLSGEHQALFIGDLNPNMIRAVWVCPVDKKSGYQLRGRPFTRMVRKDFLRQYASVLDRKRDPYKDTPRFRVYAPADNWAGMDDFIERMVRKETGSRADADFYRTALGGMDDKTLLSALKVHMWPRQYEQFKTYLEKHT